MKKILLAIIIFIFCINMQTVFAAPSLYTKRVYDVETSDGHIIKAYLSYPKTKLRSYPTVVMLHSLGYSSYYYEPLRDKFNQAGYAVLMLDFRGHGKSVYNSSFHKKSWIYYKNDTFAKYPKDVIETIDYVKKQTKKASFDNWVIIGADIGANSAVIIARDYKQKPNALVLISPYMTFKSIHIPIAMTEIGSTPILTIASKNDLTSMSEQAKLAKFAQGTFDIYNTESGGTGMLLIKKFPKLENLIVNWVKNNLSPPASTNNDTQNKRIPSIDASQLK